MKSTRIFLIATVLISALAAFLGRTSAQDAPAQPKAEATRVAVCDIAAVFNNYERVKDLNAKFNQERKDIVAKDEKRREKIKQVEKILDEKRPGSKEHDATLAELERLSVERALWRKLQEASAARRHRRLTEQMYREALDAVETVAKQRGYDLVIYRENVPIASRTTTELLNKIAERKCLYYNPAIDLTDAVLQQVNRKYKKGAN